MSAERLAYLRGLIVELERDLLEARLEVRALTDPRRGAQTGVTVPTDDSSTRKGPPPMS